MSSPNPGQRPARSLAALLLPALVLGCSADSPPSTTIASMARAPASVPEAGAAAASAGATPPATIVAHAEEHASALHRVRRWSDRVIQGAQPGGEAAFREIAALGATTVLSVDGAIPDVEGARKFGLAYVHVPIGYDGISPDEQARIVKAVQDSNGPVFVHCHHGLHRGPAAAAIARIAADGVSTEVAYKGLEESGCSPSYDGLYATVKAFVPPTREQLAALPPLPSAVKPEGVQEAMVHIDERWEYFKAAKATSWAPPADAPDKTPSHEALILRELVIEMGRLEESKDLGADFLAHVAKTEAELSALEQALKGGDTAAATKAFDGVTAACKACHITYRD